MEGDWPDQLGRSKWPALQPGGDHDHDDHDDHDGHDDHDDHDDHDGQDDHDHIGGGREGVHFLFAKIS